MVRLDGREGRHKTKCLHGFNFGLILRGCGLLLGAVGLCGVYRWFAWLGWDCRGVALAAFFYVLWCGVECRNGLYLSDVGGFVGIGGGL